MKLAETLQLINGCVRELKEYYLSPEPCEVKINQNENPFDWPDRIKTIAADHVLKRPWNRYPEFIPGELRQGLARYAGVDENCVIAGNGSNEMLLILLISLANRDMPVILVQPTFTMYGLLVRGLGARAETVYLTPPLQFDTDSICRACEQNPGALLILCSPNNPTGSALDEPGVRRILSVHRGFLVLDQAYVEFGGFNAVPLLAEFPNLLVTRTFSKAFSGAGLRLGYLLGAPEVIAHINKVKLPYNINFFSDFTGRLLLAQTALARERIAQVIDGRRDLQRFLETMPFENVYPSEANFILVRARDKDGYRGFLKREGILVRDVSPYPMLQDCLRISCGSAEENGKFKRATSEYFKK
jgi:histidinol-phosphate aminotransferase